MADVKISELTAKATPDGWEELVFAEWGSNWKMTLNTMKTFVQPTIDSSMSDESENAVQNKVVKAYVDWKTVTKSSTQPENPNAWDLWYNTSDNKLYLYDWEQRWEVGSGWSGWSFDPTGYYAALHAWLADNLYTDDNTVSVAEWNFRTTAWDVSVPSSWIWSLNNIKWKSQRTVSKTGWNIEFQSVTQGIFITNVNKYAFIDAVSNTSDTYTFSLERWSWGTDPANYWITVELQQDQFDIEDWTFSDSTWDIFKAYVTTNRGRFRMLYDTDNSVWELSNWDVTFTNADTTVFGITTPWSTDTVVYVDYFNECTDWEIVVVLTEENAWTIISANPIALIATWVNQYNWTTYIDNAEINSSWEIVAWSNKVVYVYAYGWVTNWYTAYSESSNNIINWWRCAAVPQIWTVLSQEGINIDSSYCRLPFENTWYFCVEVVDDTDLSIHPSWSWQQDSNTDAYEEYEVTIPTEDTESSPLPTDSVWIPSLWQYYDEIDFQTNKYIQRIQVTSMTYYDLLDLIDYYAGNPNFIFDYDSNYIYYYDGTSITYDISWDRTYTANDYGTERFVDSNDDIILLPIEAITSYGTNLVDKLRTWVVTKEEYPHVMDKDTYDDLPATKNTDWIIRFIFTEE